MTTRVEKHATLLLTADRGDIPNTDELRKQLQSKNDKNKIEALKAVILHILNGETMSKLFMTVIQYCLHSENHTIKRLLLLYWEVVEKTKPDGTLLPEMILVCNAMKNNLSHPNEFIRGSTLRFMCTIKSAEVLESLIPYITQNLEHRHSYVRKNAVLAVYTVWSQFPDFIPDAAELLENFLYSESNAAAKRNAFMMLYNCDIERAVAYLNSVVEQISNTDESFQLAALDLIRKVCRMNPVIKSQYIRCIYNLTNSSSNAVAFEGASTLISLSVAPTAIRAAITAYCRLLSAESDNNVKLIILSRLEPLRKRHEALMQEMLMDIMRTLSSPNIDIRQKTLDLAMSLVSPRNVDEVVQLLKKELIRTEAPEQGKPGQYRKLLVDCMHTCAIRFPDVVEPVVHLLMNYVGDEQADTAVDVVYFVREIVEEYPALRESVLQRLVEGFPEIRFATVQRIALWVLGEYAEGSGVALALDAIYEGVGPLPLYVASTAADDSEEVAGDTQTVQPKITSRPVVLADGTYAQQSSIETPVVTETKTDTLSKEEELTLRGRLLKGDFFLGAVVASSLTKLVLRLRSLSGQNEEANRQAAKALLAMVSILRVVPKAESSERIDRDSRQRIEVCMQALLEPDSAVTSVFLNDCRETFKVMLQEQRQAKKERTEKKEVEIVTQADDLISIRQLKGLQADELADDDDLTLAVGANAKPASFSSQLNRVFQLTGFGDPVYAEAHLTVLDYDIVLDLLVVNQTNSVLQNLCVELSTSRDLKLVDRPQTYNIAPFDFVKIQCNIKVSSTENGVIFGNIVYGSSSGADQTIIVLDSIHMDIVDYINPATCTASEYRIMWSELEWENKVAVNTDIKDLRQYLDHILKITNMKCLTPDATLSGQASFLAANLYARSIFGEDALLNLSVERLSSGKVAGYIRIRSKAQGIALSLGDKITNKQRLKA